MNWQLSLALVLMLAVFSPMRTDAQKSKNRTHTWWKLSFQAPPSFSKPKSIGLDAVTLVSPAKKKPGDGRMEITLVAVSAVMQEGFGNDEIAIVEYVAATFLGVTGAPIEHRSREFMGKAAAGAVFESTIPRKKEIELYVVPLSGRDKAAIALTRYSDAPHAEADAVFSILAGTLKEIKSR